MTRLTAKDFDQELLELYDFYAHGIITKREFLNKAGKFAVGGVTAVALLDLLSPNYALADQVSFTDPDISAEYVHYNSPNGNGDVRAYQVRPAGSEGFPVPAVLVVHENRGLNPYIEDVARRVAKAGFMALAPDGLTSVGGYPGNDTKGRELQSTVDGAKLMNDFFAGVEHLLGRDDAGAVGCVGFCYGGGVCNAIAVAYPELGASVPFYGRQPAASDVGRIKAALMLHYAGLDERVNAGWPDYEAALKAGGKDYAAFIYQGVNHGFHNDTTPRYDQVAADLAWGRTVAFFAEKLDA